MFKLIDKTMAKLHPDLDLITEFTSGTLPLAQAACVSIHVNNCEHCRRLSGQLTELGGALFDALEPVAVNDAQLDAVLARLDDEPPLQYQKPVQERNSTPAILQRLMSGDFSDLT